MGRSGPHLIHGSLGPPESSTQMAADRCSHFCRLTTVTDWPTDRPCYSVCNNRSHLHTTVMQPNSNPHPCLRCHSCCNVSKFIWWIIKCWPGDQVSLPLPLPAGCYCLHHHRHLLPVTQPNNIGITIAWWYWLYYLATVTAKINGSFYLPLTPGVQLSSQEFCSSSSP